LVHALAATPHAGLAGTTPRLGVAARLDAPANVFGLQGEEVRKYYPCLPPDCEDSAVSVVLLLKWRSRYECRVGSDDVAAKDVDAQVKNPCVRTRILKFFFTSVDLVGPIRVHEFFLESS
jgi:hypothetical protein